MDIKYNPDTGEFTRNGKKAGWVNSNGYLVITVSGKDHRAHRLAYFLMTGSWPLKDMDHINGNRLDNRWINLREASRSQNLFNKRIQSNNKLGIKNVSFNLGKYRVELRKNGKRVFDQSFDCPAAASISAQLAQIQIAGEFARHSVR
jgi:hypothetical protein